MGKPRGLENRGPGVDERRQMGVAVDRVERVERGLEPGRGLVGVGGPGLDGAIEYFYKGEHKADRPATRKLLEVIEGLRK